MTRRTLMFAAALSAALARPGLAADMLSLSEISAYLNGLTTAETTFTQINADGTGSSGRVYIQRPGRMRFEYDKPDKTLVLASGGQVAIFDDKSNQPPEQYPLSKTPLGLILGANIDLERARMVVGHDQEGDLTVVTAQDPDHPDYGSIALGFAQDPLRLRQWIVTDQTGGQTTVLLDDLTVGKSYPADLFSISSEQQARNTH